MARRSGFTLADTMAAMLIISLAMVGLLQGTQMIARVQRANAAERQHLVEGRALQASLQRLLRAPGADNGALSQTLKGSPAGFEFGCTAGVCSARLTAQGGRNWLTTQAGAAPYSAPLGRDAGSAARFVYVGRAGQYETWPADDAPTDETLRAVRLEAGDRPLAFARVWLEQSGDCNYDLISHQCRPR